MGRQTWFGLMVAVGLMTPILVAGGQQDPRSVIDFEKGNHGWYVLPGADGKVELTSNTPDVKSGKQALQYTYTAGSGILNVLFRLEPESWAEGFRFWVKTSRPTVLAFAITEESEERWQVAFWVGGNQWQQVNLALSDFERAEDSPSQNGKLDMQDAVAVGFVDVGAILFTIPETAILFGEQKGTRMLWLDDFEFLSKAPARTQRPDMVDDFQRDYLSWIATQGVQIRKEGNAMRVEYDSPIPGIFAVLKPLTIGSLKNTRGVQVNLSVRNSTLLALVVEEEDGERWQATREIGGDEKVENWQALWSSFTITDDTKGKGDGKFDPAKVKLLSLIDVGIFLEMGTPSNRWQVRSVQKVR
ncbi:MAG: carbohydrate binding domain-containing protein [Fimbriimonadales bacterium]